MVNWFRRGESGGLLWPGFGDNIRVLQWVLGRTEGSVPASGRPVGWVPTRSVNTNAKTSFCFDKESVKSTRLISIHRDELSLLDTEECEDIHELLSTPTSFWRAECEEMRNYFLQQVLPILLHVMWSSRFTYEFIPLSLKGFIAFIVCQVFIG